jgi:PAS domain S-box-containing protein
MHDADSAILYQRPLRVLILEDSPQDAELMAEMLRRAGHALTVEVTDSPEQFRQQLKQADFEVVLADYNLHGWDARDALEILHQEGKDVPLIVVTGTLGDEAAVECIKQGAADYILKDRLHRLPVAVDHALRNKIQRAEAVRLEEQIRQAKREWESTFDTVPDPIFLLDNDYSIRRCNQATANLLGLDFHAILGRPCYEVLHGRSEPLANCPHRRMLESGKNERADVEEPRLGRIFDATATPLRDAKGILKGSVHVLRDVTERKRVEEQLRQAQKMEAIGQLAGGVAHDFNNLLMAIIGYSDLLLARLRDGDHLRKHIQEIKKAGERAASLTRQLLAFSRRQVLVPQVLDLNSVVSDMQKMLRRMIGEDIELLTIPGPDLGQVRADPGQVEQVIMNLAVNARDAMPEGGRLTIETTNVELDESYTRNHIDVPPGRYVMLAVSDTGSGMDPETLSHIFEPFFTTKEEGKGTGLGLATVYGIIKQSGGHIEVSSAPGQGTTFKVYLPRIEAAGELPAPGSAVEEMPRGTETVLLVEDDVVVCELVREMLQSSGYTVLEARGAPEALTIGERYAPRPIHLLLADVVMPEMSGPQLADHLARVHPKMKVLYMSGYTDAAVMRHSKLDAPYLQKPFAPEVLARKVRETLDTVPAPQR